MTILSRRVPRELLPAHHFTKTCVGCVRLPLSGVDSKPANDDGRFPWCNNSRRIALDQEIDRHERDRASALAHADLLASFARRIGAKRRPKKVSLATNSSGRLTARKPARKRVDLSPLFANPQFRITPKAGQSQ